MPNHTRCDTARKLPMREEQRWIQWISRNQTLLTRFIENPDHSPICICQHYRMMAATFAII